MSGFTIGQAKSLVRGGIAGEAATDAELESRTRQASLSPPPTESSAKPVRSRLVDDSFPFDDSQLAAMAGMVESRYACLTGAAGTGKTTTTKGFVDRLLDSAEVGEVDLTNYWRIQPEGADEEDEYSYDSDQPVIPAIALGAYTGRASQQIKRNFPTDWHSNIMTIHRLLGFVPDYFEDWDSESQSYKKKMRFVPTYNADCRLPWDVIIIDETGMLGLDLWHQLFDALKPGCRLYFIGDINQLPPIYGKSVFGFAMARWPTFELAKVHRQAGENNPIVDNAWRVIHGIRPKTEGRFKMVEIPVDSLKASSLVRGIARKLHQLGVYAPLRDAVITPIHGINPGPGSALGDHPLNEQFSHMFNAESGPRYIIDGGREKKLFAVGDKVMATKNDWASGITNGMTGHIVEIFENPGYAGARIHYGLVEEVNARFAKGATAALPLDSSLDLDDFEALAAEAEERSGQPDSKESRDRGPASHTVVVRFGDGDAAFDKPFESLAEVGTLQLAYVVTCHKMQGGEAPTIVIILHETHSRSLSREWLYTAITRASENCIVLYTDRALRIALNRQAIPGASLREKVMSFQRIIDPKGDGSGGAGILLPHSDSSLPTILEQDIGSDEKSRETERRLTAGGAPGGLAKLIAKQQEAQRLSPEPAPEPAPTRVKIDRTIRVKVTETIHVRVNREVEAPPPPVAEPETIDGGYLTPAEKAAPAPAPAATPRLPDYWTHSSRRLVSQPFTGATQESMDHERWVASLRVPPAPTTTPKGGLTLGQLFARSAGRNQK